MNKDEILLDSSAVELLKEAVGGGGQGGSQQYATAYMHTNGYLSSFTFVCEDPNIETFRDLVQYLYDRGFKYYDNVSCNSYLPCSGDYDIDGFILAGGLSGDIYEDTYLLRVATTEGVKEVEEDEFLDFSITYLGQEQGE